VNTPASLPVVEVAQERVLGWQTKLHRWAAEDENKRFGDLFNLLCDPATLVVAWERVKRNRGSKTAGVDGETRKRIEQAGVENVLGELRQSLRDGSYAPLPVREREIPKRGSGKVRSLGCSLEPPALPDLARRRNQAGDCAKRALADRDETRLRMDAPAHVPDPASCSLALVVISHVGCAVGIRRSGGVSAGGRCDPTSHANGCRNQPRDQQATNTVHIHHRCCPFVCLPAPARSVIAPRVNVNRAGRGMPNLCLGRSAGSVDNDAMERRFRDCSPGLDPAALGHEVRTAARLPARSVP
jgi:hypothetical protein